MRLKQRQSVMSVLRNLLLVVVTGLVSAWGNCAFAAEESHGEANINPLSFDPDLAIFTAIVFVMLLLVLRKFAWGPITEALDKREQGIADFAEQAKQSAQQAEQTLVKYQAQLDTAAEEVREMIAEARRDADSTKQRIVAEAQDAAQKERDRALADIKAAKNKALSELAQKSVDTAVALAGQVVRREIKTADHAALIQEALQKFPSQN